MIYDVLKIHIDQSEADFQRVYKHCCTVLGLSTPAVYLFSKSESNRSNVYNNWVFQDGKLVGPQNHRDFKGFAREFNKDLFIRAGLTKKETLLTLCHEMYHVWEYKIGKSCVDEDLAEEFAHETYNQLINKQI